MTTHVVAITIPLCFTRRCVMTLTLYKHISPNRYFTRNQKSDGQYKMRSRMSLTAREEEEKRENFSFFTFCLDEEGNQIKRRKLKCISDGRLLWVSGRKKRARRSSYRLLLHVHEIHARLNHEVAFCGVSLCLIVFSSSSPYFLKIFFSFIGNFF